MFTSSRSAKSDARSVVTDIYRSTLVRDVLTRNKIRDANMFERVATFAIDNVGNPFSARRVADFMKSQRRQVSHETVLNYLSALEEAFVITRVPRYDLRSRARGHGRKTLHRRPWHRTRTIRVLRPASSRCPGEHRLDGGFGVADTMSQSAR